MRREKYICRQYSWADPYLPAAGEVVIFRLHLAGTTVPV